MNKRKAIVDFSGYAAAELAPVAQTIHDKMTENAATFATPPVTMAALQTLIDDFNTKLAAKASRASADVLAFNMVRENLEGTLSELGHYLNQVAMGDPDIVEKSGFPSFETGHQPASGAPAAPTDLRLRHGDQGGQIVARYRPDRPNSMNEVQKSTGDPNDAASWVHVGMFSRGKATITGLTPGQVVWIRVRTCGLSAVMGAWSDPAQIRVL